VLLEGSGLLEGRYRNVIELAVAFSYGDPRDDDRSRYNLIIANIVAACRLLSLANAHTTHGVDSLERSKPRMPDEIRRSGNFRSRRRGEKHTGVIAEIKKKRARLSKQDNPPPSPPPGKLVRRSRTRDIAARYLSVAATREYAPSTSPLIRDPLRRRGLNPPLPAAPISGAGR